MCVLMVDWLTLSAIWAAENPPASTTLANTFSSLMSPSLRVPSIGPSLTSASAELQFSHCLL